MIDLKSLVTLSENVVNGTIGEELYENVTIEYVDDPNVTLTEAVHMPTIAILECQLESAEFVEAYNDCIVECTVKALTEGAMPEYESLTEAAAEGFKEKLITAWEKVKAFFTQAWGKVVQVFTKIKNALIGVKKALEKWEYAEGMEISKVTGHIYKLDPAKINTFAGYESLLAKVNGVKADTNEMTAEYPEGTNLYQEYLFAMIDDKSVFDMSKSEGTTGSIMGDIKNNIAGKPVEFEFKAQGANLAEGTFNKEVVLKALEVDEAFDKVVNSYKNIIHELEKQVRNAKAKVFAKEKINAVKDIKSDISAKQYEKTQGVEAKTEDEEAKAKRAEIKDAFNQADTEQRKADLAPFKMYKDVVDNCNRAASDLYGALTVLNKQRAAEYVSMAKAMLNAGGAKKAEKPAEDAEAKTEDAEGGETITVMDFGM